MEVAAEVDEEANRGGGAGNLHYSRRRRRRQRRRRPSLAASSETTTDGSFRFTDSDSDQSWASAAGGPYEECRFSAAAERLRHSRRNALSVPGWVSDEEIDLESGELELKSVGKEVEEETRDCRICRLSLSGSGGIGGDGELEPSSGDAIQLGCSCRGDLGTAHKQCAETWFKIRGNTTCEICGETAVNISGEQTAEENETSGGAAYTAPTLIPETQRYWNGRRIMNILLASMILAFVISWLFHFNILP